jgi:hypothetical protein
MAIDLSSDQLNAFSVPLCNQSAEIPSPELHAEVLRERARRLTDGEAVRAPWSKAKAHLQRLVE